MEEQIERHLITRAQRGDLEAFEKLIIQYEKRIYNICLRMLENEQEAYDGAQEICVKVWKNIHNFEGNSKFSTWIYRIATNQCLDILRKRKHIKDEVSLYQTAKDSSTQWILEETSQIDPTQDYVEHIALEQVINEALGEIKEEYRQILVLRDVEGYTYEEMSELLKINKGTVKSRLSRARLAMKQILSQNKEPYRSFFRQSSMKEGNL